MPIRESAAGVKLSETWYNAANVAAEAAKEGNALTREMFIAEQRPWLLWRVPNTATVTRNDRRLNITVVGEIENIGKTPALNISYFGKFYSPPVGDAMLHQGIAYYDEHLTSPDQFALANILPTEKAPIRFSPHGIDITDLPTDRDFALCLVFHATYEVFRQTAEIGAVYLIQPIKAQKVFFHIGDLGQSTPVRLMEWEGVRRIT
jgi:hypothetical protein